MLFARGTGRLFRRALTAFTLFVVAALVPGVAFAYHTDGRETRNGVTYACTACHVTWSGGSDFGGPAGPGAGPHGYYRSNTNKCKMCHSVHRAPSPSLMLLPAATIQATCFTCHDHTGAAGVYSSITARGGLVVSEHSTEATTHIPGGSFDLDAKLGCASCHAVHRATTVAGFRTDRQATVGDGGGAKYTNQLLRDDVGGKPRGTYTKYGADWCSGCHDQRHSGGAVMNHPTESSATAGFFWYGRVAVVASKASATTVIDDDIVPGSGLGLTNRGYVMPYPRTAQQSGHAPICQQCHEDARDVGNVGAVVPFKPSPLDGALSSDTTNPVYYAFPHQGTNRYLLLEVNDDLCLNCHPVMTLP